MVTSNRIQGVQISRLRPGNFIHIRRLVRQSRVDELNEKESVAMLNQDSSEDRSYLRRGFRRAVLSTALLLASVASASAYTLVFRDGRRVEIPDDFTVTRTTVTYEVSPGFNRTILVAVLD